MFVYVAAPFADGPYVRIVHETLVSHGITPTSRWASIANGPEDFASSTPAALRRAAAENDADLRGSDVALVLARHGAGGEMFSEARIALEWGKPIVWVGRRILSAWRSGVVLVEDLDDAILVLTEMRTQHANGIRGLLLAQLVRGAA